VSSVTNMYGMFYDADNLSDDNKCYIHTEFSSNDNWGYDWEEYCPEPFQPETRDELKDAVDEWIDDSDSANSTYGTIDTWDTSLITDMEGMFRYSGSFNGDISDWDVSSVTDMSGMFNDAESFNQDISDWDVSSVTDMGGMFYDATLFNQDISGWDVSNVTDMGGMFSSTDSLSDDNKCYIHTSFSSNDNWEYDWEEYCSDD